MNKPTMIIIGILVVILGFLTIYSQQRGVVAKAPQGHGVAGGGYGSAAPAAGGYGSAAAPAAGGYGSAAAPAAGGYGSAAVPAAGGYGAAPAAPAAAGTGK